MSRKTRRQLEGRWKEECDLNAARERMHRHRVATKRLLEGLGRLRSKYELGLNDETTFNHSPELNKSVLCGVSYEFIDWRGQGVKIEITHHSGEVFLLIFSTKGPPSERYLYCKVRFKQITKVLEFMIPFYKEP